MSAADILTSAQNTAFPAFAMRKYADTCLFITIDRRYLCGKLWPDINWLLRRRIIAGGPNRHTLESVSFFGPLLVS